MSRSTGMCESDDGQDDLMSRSTGMCESDQPTVSRLKPLLLHGLVVDRERRSGLFGTAEADRPLTDDLSRIAPDE